MINNKQVQNSISKTELSWESDPLWSVLEIEILPYYKLVYEQTRICPDNWDKNFSGVLR